MNLIRRVATAALAVGVVCAGGVAQAAQDTAADAAYAAEAGGAWKGANPTLEENPPGTDNGGTGFGIWDFSGGFHDSGLSPYGRINHFIDGVDFAASPFNNLGAPAWGLTNANQAFFGFTARALRPLASPLAVGQTISIDIDTPSLFDGLGGPSDAPGVIINLLNSAKAVKVGALASPGFNNNEWGLYDATGGNPSIDTNIAFADTDDGSSYSFTLTSADAGTLVLDGQSFNITNLKEDGTDIAYIDLVMYSNGSAASGEREFFFNNLPEPGTLGLAAGMVALLGLARRRNPPRRGI
jgi:hypothetical protein